MHLRLLGFVSCVGLSMIIACSDSDSGSGAPATDADGGDAATTPPSEAGGGDSGPTQDATDAPATTGASCGAATATLAQTADPGAPVLDATSNLQRVDSNDAFCAGRSNGQLATFGSYGYQLTVRFADAENDGPMSLDDVQKEGVVRLASDPDIAISTRTDPKRFSTGGGIIIQLCLDKVYAADALAIGVDLADNAGHRGKAICVKQQSGS